QMKKKWQLGVSLVLCFTLLFVVGCSNNGKKEVEKFPEKNITLIVPVPPGGGMDGSARLTAKYMEKYLPNNVSIVVKNMPGSGFAEAINEVYNAKSDGYTFGVFLPGTSLNQALGKLNVDFVNMKWIGSYNNDMHIAASVPNS